MTRRLAVLALVTAAIAWRTMPALAHPLNVFVQVAEIDVTRSAVAVELRLTPGVNVADAILSDIDANHDAVITDAEQTAYAERVRRDVTLTVDGGPATLELWSMSFAPVSELRQGLGDIVLSFRAPGVARDGHHRLVFENHHESAIAAYLVNTLQPTDASLRVAGQERTYDQSRYQLDVDVVSASGQGRSATGGDSRAAIESFFWPGVRHILTGYDHLLFLAALVLAAASLWDLVKVVTSFTVAHSITLSLAALGLVHVSDRFVEPVIAASIVFVALQNVFWPERSRGTARIAVAFLFGLFHGLGFAGGLLDVMRQMPTGTVLFAILGFSLGVEAGNQAVLLPLFMGMKAARAAPRASAMWQRLGSGAISAAGAYYLGLALVGLV
jgi:hydrogenase/urease accessory protein HupE